MSTYGFFKPFPEPTMAPSTKPTITIAFQTDHTKRGSETKRTRETRNQANRSPNETYITAKWGQ